MTSPVKTTLHRVRHLPDIVLQRTGGIDFQIVLYKLMRFQMVSGLTNVPVSSLKFAFQKIIERGMQP